MTACVNRKHTKKVAAVVTASLVGALSLGAAPVAAVADTDIELQSVASDRYSAGEVTAVYDGNGYLLAANEDGTYPVAPGGKYDSAKVLPFSETDEVPGTVTFSSDKITSSTDPATLSYSTTAPTTPGTYYAKVSGSGDYEDGAVYIKVTVAQKTLDGVFAYEEDATDLNDVSDTTFNFNFADQKDDIKFAIGSEKITGVNVTWYKDGKQMSASDPVRNAGTYVAQIKGVSGDYNGAIAYVEVVMNKLNLASVDFSAKSYEWNDGDPISVSEPVAQYTELNGTGNITWELSGPLTAGLVVDKGDYTYTATVNPDDKAAVQNLEGTATVNFSVRGTVVDASKFTYVDPADDAAKQVNNEAFMTASNPLHFDKSSKDEDVQGFNPEKFAVAKDASSKYEQGVDYTLAYEKKNDDGTWSATSSYDEAGSYRVTATMSSGKDLAGSATAYFTVTNGTVKSANVFVSYKGEPVNDNAIISKTYDGEDILSDISVTVKIGDKILEAGTDYKVEYTLDGKVVDEAVDADDYVMTITPITYDGEAQSYNVKIAQVNITNVEVATGNFDGLLYTGSEITPSIEYGTVDNPINIQDSHGQWVANPDYVSSVLDSSLYSLKNLEYYNEDTEEWEQADAIVEPGTYRVDFSVYGDVQNFSAYRKNDVKFTVLDKLTGFEDIKSTDWFVGVVNNVNNKGWMTGLKGTKLFAPTAEITRADVACVLFNMADGVGYLEKSSVFSDVDDYAYYTAAINWAGKTQIVNGYGDGTFAPLANITREEFAAMLSNYAKAYGVYVAPSADLSKFEDANTVSDWAAEGVSWAVENGIMGNGGFLAGQSTITRAEVAAMVSNFANAFDVE